MLGCGDGVGHRILGWGSGWGVGGRLLLVCDCASVLMGLKNKHVWCSTSLRIIERPNTSLFYHKAHCHRKAYTEKYEVTCSLHDVFNLRAPASLKKENIDVLHSFGGYSGRVPHPFVRYAS